jgi:hypothetical protein
MGEKIFMFKEKSDPLFPILIFYISVVLFVLMLKSLLFFSDELLNWLSYEIVPENISKYKGLYSFYILWPLLLVVTTTFFWVISMHLWRSSITKDEVKRIIDLLTTSVFSGFLTGFIISILPAIIKRYWHVIPVFTTAMTLLFLCFGIILTCLPKRY